MVFEQVLKADMYYSGMLRRVYSEAGCLYRRTLHEITREAQQGFLLKMRWRCQGDFTFGCWWTAQGKRKKTRKREKSVTSIPNSRFLIQVKNGACQGSGLLVFFLFSPTLSLFLYLNVIFLIFLFTFYSLSLFLTFLSSSLFNPTLSLLYSWVFFISVFVISVLPPPNGCHIDCHIPPRESCKIISRELDVARNAAWQEADSRSGAGACALCPFDLSEVKGHPSHLCLSTRLLTRRSHLMMSLTSVGHRAPGLIMVLLRDDMAARLQSRTSIDVLSSVSIQPQFLPPRLGVRPWTLTSRPFLKYCCASQSLLRLHGFSSLGSCGKWLVV